MANKNLFGAAAKAQRSVEKHVPKATGKNAAGGAAYQFAPTCDADGNVVATADARLALAQYCATGTLASTYYMDETMHLETVLKLIAEVDDEFLAKAAVWSRREAFLKDMPALLLAALAARGGSPQLVEKVWMEVVDNPKMVRNVLQILRSGALVGPDGQSRTTLPRRIRSLTETWLQVLSPYQLLNATVGTDPTLKDIINMVHARPQGDEQRAAWAWVRGDITLDQRTGKTPQKGKAARYEHVPLPMRGFDALKVGLDIEGDDSLATLGRSKLIQRLDHRLLTSLNLSTDDWADIARGAKWHALRMNLATFARHGVWEKYPKLATELAAKLRDPENIRKSKAYPYQTLVAYRQLERNDAVPRVLKDALQDAIDLCCENVPRLEGNVHIAVDVSGSMQSPVTGKQRGRKPSAATCRDVAALIASAFLRKNPEATVWAFTTELWKCQGMNPRDSLMTNIQKLNQLPAGATDCAVVLEHLVGEKIPVDTLIFASDYESWFEPTRLTRTNYVTSWSSYPGRTVERPSMAVFWHKLVGLNKKANDGAGPRLVCCDLQPRTDHQITEQEDTLLVGGWSDRAFDLIDEFARGDKSRQGYAARIEAVNLD